MWDFSLGIYMIYFNSNNSIHIIIANFLKNNGINVTLNNISKSLEDNLRIYFIPNYSEEARL